MEGKVDSDSQWGQQRGLRFGPSMPSSADTLRHPTSGRKLNAEEASLVRQVARWVHP
ncbi:MAG: hypothetical protein ACPIOQ_32850 [Promethearchaeia archaeon]